MSGNKEVKKLKSIITDDLGHCFVCGDRNVAIHHIYGGRNRKISDTNGFIVPLCPFHHNMSDHAVHFNKILDLALKRTCQKIYEENHTRAEFMGLIGRNYLE